MCLQVPALNERVGGVVRYIQCGAVTLGGRSGVMAELDGNDGGSSARLSLSMGGSDQPLRRNMVR